MFRKLASLLFVAAFAALLGSTPNALAQEPDYLPQTATLVARRIVDDNDNYNLAAFSFKYGGNGPLTQRRNRNNWDLLFGNAPDRDTFDVTMVGDDCSRIKDLGELTWSDALMIGPLEAYDKPTRELSVSAVTGHMYLVHSKDRDIDLYALFRVEALQPLESVTISWKVIPAPTATSN